MKKITLWTLYSLLALLVMTSCQKENIDTLTEKEETVTPTITTIAPPTNALFSRTSSEDAADEVGISLDCITIIFPFNLLDNTGGIHEIDSEEAFAELFEETFDTTQYIVDFEFPLNVSLNGETAIVVEDNDQLGALFAECVPDGGWDDTYFPAYLIDDENSCYKTVYPISLEDATDGSIITVENEASFIEVLVEKEVYFHFPITLTDETEEVTVATVEQLFDVLFSCNEFYQDSLAWDYEDGFEYIYCYQVNFPLDVVLSGGTTKTVNNHEELCELMLQGELADYAYPLTLISPEGEEVIAESAEALEVLFEACDYDIGGFEESDVLLLAVFAQPFTEDSTSVCYTVNYPVSGTYVDETGATQTVVFNSEEEIFESQNFPPNGDTENAGLNLVYPVEVTKQSDNQVVTINTIEDLFEVVEECSEGL